MTSSHARKSDSTVATVTPLLICSLLLACTLLLALFGWEHFRHENDWRQTQLRELNRFYSDHLAISLEYPIWNIEDQQIRSVGQSLMQDHNVFAVRIRDHSRRDHQFILTRDDDWIVAESSFIAEIPDLLRSTSPISHQGKIIGEVEVILTSRFIDQEIQGMVVNYALSILLADVVLVAVIYLILKRLLLAPLQSIESFANAVRTDNQDGRTINSALFIGELRRLRNAILDMVGQLQARYQELQQSQTDLHASEQEKSLTRQRLKAVIDAMPSAVIGLDENLNIILWNAVAERFFGQNQTESQGTPILRAIPALAPCLDEITRCARTGRPGKAERLQLDIASSRRTLEVRCYPLVAADSHGAVIRIEDITERLAMQEVMVQSEKMASVGGMAAGMAHEINNPLGIIMQSAQNIIRRIDPDLPSNVQASAAIGADLNQIQRYMVDRGIPKYAGAIREAGERAANIVSGMLEFSRRSESRLAPHHPADLIRAAVELAENDYDLSRKYDVKRISIRTEIADDLPRLECTATEIEQVLLNLLKNAAQALAVSGTPEPRITLRAVRDEDHIRIEVEDNGPGMTPSVRAKVFDPFFTTKPPGHGTGLGLAVSYFIITDNHKGSIVVESEPDRGTKFILRLPIEHAA